MIPKSIRSVEEIDLAAEILTKGINNAYEESCPVRTKTTNRTVPWWNNKLDKLRKDTRKLFNKAKRTNKWDCYKRALTEYNKEIRKSKRASWRGFCDNISTVPQGARIHKILAKERPKQIGLLRRPNGSFTSNEGETIELLAAVHFPAYGTTDGGAKTSPKRPKIEDWRRAAAIIRPEAVRWAVDSFKPLKTGGLDGIQPIVLQQGLDILLPAMIKIFRASYALGHIPEPWNNSKVLFIPKAGRKDYAEAKSFRPISLTSFLLKTLEKILDYYIREKALIDSPIHSTQHAYRRGRSTETALLYLVDRVEKALEDKQIALCAFLDIEGAFDSTPTTTLVKGLQHKHLDPTTIQWITAMLSNRTATLSLHGTSMQISTRRGCPQGGVLSPLLWTLAVDNLLLKLHDRKIDAIGYADDLVVIIRGFCQTSIADQMQLALNTISGWCHENELNINADKTVIVPFTRKRLLDNLYKPTLNGNQIQFSTEVKYLGVILDQKLTWNPHITNIT